MLFLPRAASRILDRVRDGRRRRAAYGNGRRDLGDVYTAAWLVDATVAAACSAPSGIQISCPPDWRRGKRGRTDDCADYARETLTDGIDAIGKR